MISGIRTMSTAASSSRTSRSLFDLPSEKGNEVLGLVWGALFLLLAAALVSYHPNDPSVLHRAADPDTSPENLIGPFGAQLSALAFAFFGLTALTFPVLIGGVAWKRLAHKKAEPVRGRRMGIVAVGLSLPPLFHLTLGEIGWREGTLLAGGALGALLGELCADALNTGGAILVLGTVLCTGGSLAVRSTLGDGLGRMARWVVRLGDRVRLAWAQKSKRRREHRQRQRVLARAERRKEERAAKVAGRASGAEAPLSPDESAADPMDLPLRVVERPGRGHFSVRRVKGEPPRPMAPIHEGAVETEPPPAVVPAHGPPPARRPPPSAAVPRSTAPPAPQQEAFDVLPEVPELPPVNLLQTSAAAHDHDENHLVQLGDTIQRSCSEFGVDGSIEGIGPGPVITVFELQPAPGVKVSRIVGLQDDLALALKAESVRIDRIPGRSTLGLEVPNPKRSIIPLGRLLADERFQKAPSVLTMALGVDIQGEPIYADLATMPHLLVAGATGAGKSVGLQSMITSILYKATREDVQFIFIDPKRIELGVYGDIPHMKTEVVVEPKKAANALRWAVAEMERRYRLLAEVHVRSIDYYNRAIRDPNERRRLSLKEGDGESPFSGDLKPLPYYVIIIDELADLMMVASSDVETSIARLAQMARAVGIHLIVATQRPSVDVITGTIKANFPCRIAYATATRHDSRTILDAVGAEKLLGKGDALFMPPGTSRIRRLHGAYISEQETAALIRWLKRRGKPDLDMEVVQAPPEESSGGGGGGGDDDLFDEAARLCVTERMGSASFLQRRLRVGFSRAARLIDMLEADGLLGPAQGSKPRDVLVPPDFFDEVERSRAGVVDASELEDPEDEE